MTIVTVCRVCGREFEPNTAAIRSGHWRTCPACPQRSDNPTPRPMAGQCQKCGRPLLNKDRALCLQCLGFSIS